MPGLIALFFFRRFPPLHPTPPGPAVHTPSAWGLFFFSFVCLSYRRRRRRRQFALDPPPADRVNLEDVQTVTQIHCSSNNYYFPTLLHARMSADTPPRPYTRYLPRITISPKFFVSLDPRVHVRILCGHRNTVVSRITRNGHATGHSRRCIEKIVSERAHRTILPGRANSVLCFTHDRNTFTDTVNL